MSKDARAGKRRSMSRTLLRAMLAAAAIAATAAGAAVGVAAALAQRGSKKEGRKRPYKMSGARNVLPAPFSLDTFAATLVQLNVPFESYFRLPRPLMEGLIERLSPHLRSDKRQAERTAGHCITPEQRVAIALRWMAGAQWQDIVIGLAPVCLGEVYKSVWVVVDAINCEHASAWSCPTPGPNASEGEKRAAGESCIKLETRFRDKSPSNCMKGVVGAIDGCIIRTGSPGSAVENPLDCYCERKKMFGMLLMAASDADMVIRCWVMRFTPKCHDSTAWNHCTLGAWVAAGGLPWPCCFLGDKAFRPGNAGLLTPGANAGTSDVCKCVQSRGRMPAEQMFGILLKTCTAIGRVLFFKC